MTTYSCTTILHYNDLFAGQLFVIHNNCSLNVKIVILNEFVNSVVEVSHYFPLWFCNLSRFIESEKIVIDILETLGLETIILIVCI